MKRLLLFLLFICIGQIHGQIISTVVGNGTAAYNGDGGPAINAEISAPNDIAIDKKGNMYIVDYGNNIIRKVDTSGIISTFAGNGTFGYSGDGGPAINATFQTPIGVATDSAGNVYIADYENNAIRMVNTIGVISTVVGNGTLGYIGRPTAVRFDVLGNMYIADLSNSCIRKVNTSGIISTIAGNGTSGYSGDGGPAINASLSNLWDVAIDPTGNVYVSDWGNNVVRKIDNSGIINVFAGNHAPGFGGDGGPATSAYLLYPLGLACDSLGNVFISDGNNNRVRKVATSSIISTIAGGGSGGLGDGGLATNAKLSTPRGIAFDKSRNVYIVDVDYNRIRKVSYCATPITISITGLDTICRDSNNVLTANGASTYSWSANAGSAATNTAVVNPVTNTSYSVNGITGECIATASFTVKVSPIIRLSNIVCSGDTATISAIGANSYTWSANAGAATTNSVSVSPSVNTSYTVEGTDSRGCIDSYSFLLDIGGCGIYGINQYLESFIRIYPNPTSDQFFIETNTTDKLNVDLYDVNGRHVFSTSVMDKSNIDVTTLDNGAYTLTIKSVDRVTNKKLVIAR